jgi:hypothetical protein
MNRKIVLCVVLMFFLAETSLLSADHQRAQLATQANVNPTLNDSNLASSYDNVTTHEGDLVIDGSQTFVIENCTYIQTGNMQVRDWGRLIVRDSKLLINQTYLWQYNFTIEDYGTFEIDNSTFTSDRALNIDFNGYSEATFDTVTLNLTQTFIRFHDFSKTNLYQSSFPPSHGLYFDGYSEGSITNSDLTQIQVQIGVGASIDQSKIKVINSSISTFGINFDPSSSAEVNHLRPGFIGYLNLQQAAVNGVILDITLNDTSVGEWAVQADCDSGMTISDSVIGRLGIYIHNPTVCLDSFNPVFYEYKEMGKIILNETLVTGITVWFYDSVATVINSTLRLYPYSQSKLYVNESIVSLQVEESDFSGNLCFERSTLQGIDIFNTDFYMYGTVSLDLSGEFHWFSTKIKRNYNISLKDDNNNSVENAGLILLDQKNTVVWNGTTDNLGQADFNITFTDSNYTDSWRLNISKVGFYNETMDIGFLSDTPVSIVLTEKIPGDINLDREVNLADLVLLAQAYGSKPGDSNWNPNADINGNGIVDLADLVILAQHYGQHNP